MASVGFSPSLHVAHASVRPSRRGPAGGSVASSASGSGSGSGANAAATEQHIELLIKSQLAQNKPLRTVWTQRNAPVAAESSQDTSALTEQRKKEWRAIQQYKTKTLHFVLFMCLNGGCDPPDQARIEPCAKLECWCDPTIAQAKLLQQSSDAIAEALEAQYKGIQKEGVYKKSAESTLDDARTVMLQMRRKAKDGRVLFHYNGHGMPKATTQGELWFFDKEHTHYHPLGIKEILSYTGSPALFVIDCNGAGGIIHGWKALPESHNSRDVFLCACGDGEFLPSNPKLPADVFTACLTTPLRMALEWYTHYSHRELLLPDVAPEMIRNLPGEWSNRKTILGELHWILNAVTETIAWAVLPRHLFYTTFRSDPVVVKTLYRNFLLADKLMREMGVTPVSHPPLPPGTHLHEMWGAWEVALEGILCQLPSILDESYKLKPNAEYRPSTFFADQLTAFEVWLDVGNTAEVPLQLPCLVLGLVQTNYRVRALTLLCRYLSVPQKLIAVQNALYCGTTPYLSKLLNYPDVSLLLIVAWMQFIRVDEEYSCGELLRHQAERPFLKLLSLSKQSVLSIDASLEGNSAIGVAGQQQAPSPSTEQPQGTTAGTPPGGVPPTQGTPASTSTTSLGPPTWSTADVSSLVAPPSVPGSEGDQQAQQALQRLYVMEGVTVDRCRAIAAYLLCLLMSHGGERLQTWCWNNNLLAASFTMLQPNSFSPQTAASGVQGTASEGQFSSYSPSTLTAAAQGMGASQGSAAAAGTPTAAVRAIQEDDDRLLRTWGCLVQSKMLSSLTGAKHLASQNFYSKLPVFENLLSDANPSVRAAVCFLLGHHLGWRLDLLPDEATQSKRLETDRRIFKLLASAQHDPSADVRGEVLVAVCQLVYWYAPIIGADLSEASVVQRASKTFHTNLEDRGIQSSLRAGPLEENELESKPAYLARNEPLTAPSVPLQRPLANSLHETVGFLVEDALVLISRYLAGYDKSLARDARLCLQTLAQGEGVSSNLILVEAQRSMSGLGRAAHGHSSTTCPGEVTDTVEQDKMRERRNADLLRHIILANANRTFTPFQGSGASAGAGGGPGTAGHKDGPGASPSMGSPSVAPSSPSSPEGGGFANATAPRWSIHGLPITAQEQPVAAKFRQIEPHVIHADRSGRISLSSIESLERCTLLDSFQHDSPVQDLHILNDADATPLVLVSDVYGTFSLYPMLSAPTAALGPVGDHLETIDPLFTFNAATSASAAQPLALKPIPVVSEYRPRDCMLLYSANSNRISFLSLVQQQLADQVTVPGELSVTAIAVEKGTTNVRATYVGMNDGGVRLFDDRSGDGRVGLVSLLEDHSGSTRRNAPGYDPAVLMVGTTASQPTSIFVANNNVMRIFDLRQAKKALRSFDLLKASPTTAAHPSGASGASGAGARGMQQGLGDAPSLTAAGCALSPSLPLIATVGTDGLFEATSLKGDSLIGPNRPRLGSNMSTAHYGHALCVIHPSKSLLLSGTEIVALN